MKQYKIKSLQFNVGTDLLGSAISLPIRRGMGAELVDSGVVLTSANTGRIVLVPFSNIKGIELVESPTTNANEVKPAKITGKAV